MTRRFSFRKGKRCYALSLYCLLPALFFVACAQVNAEISFNANGSGVLKLEYRVDARLENLGRLDGNENWPLLPVGRADFERSVSRIEGLSLRSYRKSRAAGDFVYSAVLTFARQEALLRFLDATGRRARITSGPSGNTLTLIASEQSDPIDASLAALFAEVSAGRAFTIRVRLPQSGQARILDGSGKERAASSAGRDLVFSLPLSELLLDTSGYTCTFSPIP